MDNYIKRSYVTEVLLNSTSLEGYDLEEAVNAICDIPASDVRPVVLCRECVHWERYGNTAGCGYCHKVKFEYGADGYVFNPVRAPDFYCAEGEKREEATNGN